MAGIVVKLAEPAFPDAFTVVVGTIALVVLVRYQPNSAWLILAGLVIGLGHALLA